MSWSVPSTSQKIRNYRQLHHLHCTWAGIFRLGKGRRWRIQSKHCRHSGGTVTTPPQTPVLPKANVPSLFSLPSSPSPPPPRPLLLHPLCVTQPPPSFASCLMSCSQRQITLSAADKYRAGRRAKRDQRPRAASAVTVLTGITVGAVIWLLLSHHKNNARTHVNSPTQPWVIFKTTPQICGKLLICFAASSKIVYCLALC